MPRGVDLSQPVARSAASTRRCVLDRVEQVGPTTSARLGPDTEEGVPSMPSEDTDERASTDGSADESAQGDGVRAVRQPEPRGSGAHLALGGRAAPQARHPQPQARPLPRWHATACGTPSGGRRPSMQRGRVSPSLLPPTRASTSLRRAPRCFGWRQEARSSEPCSSTASVSWAAASEAQTSSSRRSSASSSPTVAGRVPQACASLTAHAWRRGQSPTRTCSTQTRTGCSRARPCSARSAGRRLATTGHMAAKPISD